MKSFLAFALLAVAIMVGATPHAMAQTATTTVLPVNVDSSGWKSLGAGPLALYVLSGGVKVMARATNCTGINEQTEPLAIIRSANPTGGGVPFFSTNIVCVKGMPFGTVTFGKGS